MPILEDSARKQKRIYPNHKLKVRHRYRKFSNVLNAVVVLYLEDSGIAVDPPQSRIFSLEEVASDVYHCGGTKPHQSRALIVLFYLSISVVRKANHSPM